MLVLIVPQGSASWDVGMETTELREFLRGLWLQNSGINGSIGGSHIAVHLWSHCYVTDLTGSQDGSVQMWEWGHNQAVSVPRPSGTFAKVTRVRFSEHGNKFGVADGDGNLSLWQVGLGSCANRPFFVSISLHTCYLIVSRMTGHCLLYEIWSVQSREDFGLWSSGLVTKRGWYLSRGHDHTPQ
jgi:hypothetical protein